MTFYWWSHWFWITLLSNILLPFRFVHTYPSQGVTPDYNSNSDEKHTKPATKLYHTSSTLIWATMATTFAADRKQVDLAAGQAAIRRPPSNPSTVGMEAKTVGEEAANSGSSQSAREEVNTSTSAEYEFKRSTEEKSSARVHDEFVTALSERRQSNGGTEAEAGAEQTQGSGGAAIASEKAVNTTQPEELRKLYGSNNSSWIATSTDDSSAQAAPSPGGPSSSRHSARLEAESERRSRDERPNDRTQQLQDQQADAVDGRPLAGHKAPFTLENVNKQEEILRAENEHRTRKSKVLSAEYNHVSRFINLSTDSRNLLTRSALSASTEHDSDGSNISSEALAIQRPTHFLDAGAISAICFTVFAVCCTVGTLGVLMYRRRFLNKPQALSEPDSSVYIDDSTMRDNSDEMYSLDNDSFLNSLEAMTIQNYWTDTVKHTKL